MINCSWGAFRPLLLDIEHGSVHGPDFKGATLFNAHTSGRIPPVGSLAYLCKFFDIYGTWKSLETYLFMVKLAVQVESIDSGSSLFGTAVFEGPATGWKSI